MEKRVYIKVYCTYIEQSYLKMLVIAVDARLIVVAVADVAQTNGYASLCNNLAE